jgi:hypothetical protein
MTVDTKKLRELAEAATCVPGYEVTRDGRVLSTESNWRGYGPRELKQEPNGHGYARVRLTVDGKRTSRLVHALVAAAFLPVRPSPERQIRHINGDRMDPRAENLAWGTAKDNAADREAHGTTARGERNGFSKLTGVSVAQIRSLAERGLSQREIAARVGISQRAVGNVLRGETWRGA